MKLEIFKGRLSFLKNFSYLMILGLHAFIFIYFLFNAFVNHVFTLLSSIAFISLIGVAFYTFIASKSYYYYFYIAIIISSIPIILVIPYSGFLIVPEVIIVVILLLNGLEQGSNYYKMRVNKKANVLHHDPGVTHLTYSQGSVPMATSFRMDEVWNPDSSIPLKGEDKILESKTFNVKMQVVGAIITLICFTFSLVPAILSFKHYFIYTTLPA